MSKVHLVFGRQGSGKTTYSIKLAKRVKGVHFSIDEWMWALYGADLPKSMNLKWIMERVDRCEKQIWATAKKISDSQVDVILDLGFTKRAKRKLFKDLATESNLPIEVHYLKAEHSERKRRVLDRNKEKGETYAFEVTAGMFDFMETEFDSPTDSELSEATIVNTSSNS